MRDIFQDSWTSNSLLSAVEQSVAPDHPIRYDIIYAAYDVSCCEDDGEPQFLLRRHHTTKGSMTLTKSHDRFQGTVQIEDATKQLDIPQLISDFSWMESSRKERIHSSRNNQSSAWDHACTSTWFVESQSRVLPEATGELRRLLRPTAVFLQSQQQAQLSVEPSNEQTINLATQRMKDYEEKRCLWMHRHTILPAEVIHRIAEFVSPPPVLFLEKGDMVLDMDWSTQLSSQLSMQWQGRPPELPIEFFARSTIIARRSITI